MFCHEQRIQRHGSSFPKETKKGRIPRINLKGFQNLSSEEMLIVTKLNHISEYIKDLEGNLLKTRENLQRKSTIEGRENNKICAVQGTIISNKKNYYQNLETNINSLFASFQDQFKKIIQEFDSLQAISKGRFYTFPNEAAESESRGYLTPQSIKLPEFLTLKTLKNSDKKSEPIYLKTRSHCDLTKSPGILSLTPKSNPEAGIFSDAKSSNKVREALENRECLELPNEILRLDDCYFDTSDQDSEDESMEELESFKDSEVEKVSFSGVENYRF